MSRDLIGSFFVWIHYSNSRPQHAGCQHLAVYCHPVPILEPQVDALTVYYKPDHEIYNTWVALSAPVADERVRTHGRTDAPGSKARS